MHRQVTGALYTTGWNDDRQQGKVWHSFKDILGIVFLVFWLEMMNGEKFMKKSGTISVVRGCWKIYGRKQGSTKPKQKKPLTL